MSRTLTLQTLIDKGACSEQVELFRVRFGKSVRVTQRLCVSVAYAFDWNWAAQHLLSRPARAEYQRAAAAAWAEYARVLAPARAEYQRATAPAAAEYERVTAPAWAEYARVVAAAWAEYARVEAAAWAEYEVAAARTFAKLYNGDKS